MLRYVFVVIIILFSCAPENKYVETISILTEKNIDSDIYIYFDQDVSVGKVDNKKGEFIFKIEKNNEVYFLKEEIGKGFIKFYRIDSNDKNEVFYFSPMTLNNAPDSSFQIVGGSLREFYDSINKTNVKFITFKSNYAFKLKGNWQIKESLAREKYFNTLMGVSN